MPLEEHYQKPKDPARIEGTDPWLVGPASLAFGNAAEESAGAQRQRDLDSVTGRRVGDL